MAMTFGNCDVLLLCPVNLARKPFGTQLVIHRIGELFTESVDIPSYDKRGARVARMPA